jgi:hypothetical protein
MGAARSLDTFRKVSAERVRDEWVKSHARAPPQRGLRGHAPHAPARHHLPRDAGVGGLRAEPLPRASTSGVTRWLASTPPSPSPCSASRAAARRRQSPAPALSPTRRRTTRSTSTSASAPRWRAHPRAPALLATTSGRAWWALIRHHLICYSDDWTDAAVRRWLRRVTPELAPLPLSARASPTCARQGSGQGRRQRPRQHRRAGAASVARLRGERARRSPREDLASSRGDGLMKRAGDRRPAPSSVKHPRAPAWRW